MTNPDMERLFEALEGTFFGKYRGEVVDNDDPNDEARLLVRVPAVMGREDLWALPCVPFAGPNVGFFALPPVGARVWVEFEAGDPNYPIWTGCYWLSGEIPAADADPSIVYLRTAGVTLRIDDAAGVLELETVGGSKLTISGDEISLEASTIKNTAGSSTTELASGGFDAMGGALKVV